MDLPKICDHSWLSNLKAIETELKKQRMVDSELPLRAIISAAKALGRL